MGAYDFQFGAKKEVTFNTPVVVDDFFEYNDEVAPFLPVSARTEGNPLRVGTRARRKERAIPYISHAEGTLKLDVMNKGWGFWLEHMLPNVVTTGVGPYTHTATEGTNSSALMGKSFTGQFNAPFHPAGTNQAFTASGGKVPKWMLGCDVEGMLIAELDLWFASFTTATALAAASYPTSMTSFAWSHGVITVGGSAFDITSFSLDVDQGYKLPRPQIRGNTASKEPTPGPLTGSFALTADFDSLTQFNRVHTTTIASMYAQIIGTWTNGADVLTATISAPRFDEFSLGGEPGALEQELTGVIEGDGTTSPVTLAYTTGDATP